MAGKVSEAAATLSGRRAAKAARRRVPMEMHAQWDPPADRPDPVGLLEQQGQNRVGELLPIRYGRMLNTPLAFFAGAVAIMAWDLARTPVSRIRAQLCGDAHLGNFRSITFSDRTLVFDIDDFDETLPGPWEWDVKRLAASLEIAARDAGIAASRRRKIVASAGESYRAAMREFARSGLLDVWYRRLDVRGLVRSIGARLRRRARSDPPVEKNIQGLDGDARFLSSPPQVERFADMMPRDEAGLYEDETRRYLDGYRNSLTDDHRRILDGYEFRDLARRVVGIGSVGIKTNVVLLVGRERSEPLVLQLKEACRSVLEPFAGKSAYARSGRRVVEGQRLMQASSDILLGWVHGPGLDGITRDYYVRQVEDSLAPDPQKLTAGEMRTLGQAAAWTLARAHARSGDRVAIAAYLGQGTSFASSFEKFASAYADQNQRDYEQFVAAVDRGRIVARRGV